MIRRHALRAFRKLDRKGAAAVEFALLMPFILIMLIGLVDFGMGLWTQMQLESAARAGAQYALIDYADTSGIQNAVTGSSNLTTAPTPLATTFCECSNGTSVSCAGTCASGSVRIFVRVTATSSFTPLLSYPGMPNPFTLRGGATIRVQ